MCLFACVCVCVFIERFERFNNNNNNNNNKLDLLHFFYNMNLNPREHFESFNAFINRLLIRLET